MGSPRSRGGSLEGLSPRPPDGTGLWLEDIRHVKKKKKKKKKKKSTMLIRIIGGEAQYL